jgi:hypothetical protein
MVRAGLWTLVLLALAWPAAGQDPDSAAIRIDFENLTAGVYTEAALESQWGRVGWRRLEDRGQIVADPDSVRGQVLRVSYPQGAVGGRVGGVQFLVPLAPAPEYWLSYYVLFEDGFDFRRGGKLPGLTSGGSVYTGGTHPEQGEGWSARYMWKQGGDPIVYLYYVDMPGRWGENLALGDAKFVPGRWHHLVQHIRVNTPDGADGLLEVWFDGEKVLERTDLRLRIGRQGEIDSFFFSTFHGGNTPDYAPRVDSAARFDGFSITRSRPASLAPEAPAEDR